jgi:hypothetical protein
MQDRLKVTCCLTSPIAGDIPMLDSIIEWEMAHRLGKGEAIQRDRPAPPYGEIPVPYLRQGIGGLSVPCCSSPILEPCRDDVEFFAKRIATEHSHLLAEKDRRMVPTGNGVFKSYRIPLRIRDCRRIVWFLRGERREIRKILKNIVSLGKKRSFGYARVGEWIVENVDEDWSWFAKTEAGSILMRPLPFCEDLPKDLIGARRDFGAAQSPYWHPDRYMERVIPC